MSYTQKKQDTPAIFWRAVALSFMFTSMLLAIGMSLLSNRMDPAKLVYLICNEARTDLTINEHGCTEVQAQLRIKFKCEQHNTDPDNHCWVEEK